MAASRASLTRGSRSASAVRSRSKRALVAASCWNDTPRIMDRRFQVGLGGLEDGIRNLDFFFRFSVALATCSSRPIRLISCSRALMLGSEFIRSRTSGKPAMRCSRLRLCQWPHEAHRCPRRSRSLAEFLERVPRVGSLGQGGLLSASCRARACRRAICSLEATSAVRIPYSWRKRTRSCANLSACLVRSLRSSVRVLRRSAARREIPRGGSWSPK